MNDAGYIYVVGWERFQHPDVVRGSTRMPWIRNYVDLLENEAYLELTAAERALLECIWKWTGVCGNGRTSAKVATLRARFRLRNCDLEPLIDAGFIEVRASKAQAERKHVAPLDREEKREELKPLVDRTRSTTWPTVWSAYTEHHPTSKPTPKRKRLLAAREKEGFAADTLLAAVHGNHADPWCNGDNRDGKTYHAFELIFRDAAHVEQYAAIAANGHNADHKISREEMDSMIAEAEARGFS